MADIKPRRVSTPIEGSGTEVYVWDQIAAGDTIFPLICGPWPDKTIQVEGSFGGNIAIEGCIDPARNDVGQATGNFRTLNDPQGNPLSGINSARIETVLEHIYYLRPSAGVGVTATDVWIFLSNVKG